MEIPLSISQKLREVYPTVSTGPYVGKPCYMCQTWGRYIVTPVGLEPAHAGTQVCARHLSGEIGKTMDDCGRAVVVQEVPRTTRYYHRPGRTVA